MAHLWHDDRYLPLGLAEIKPVLTGNAIKTVFLKFPGEKEFPVQGDEAQKVLDYVLRNNVNSVRTNGNGNGKHEESQKRVISEDKLNRMRSTQSKRKKEWWDAHPDRWSKSRKIAAGIPVDQ